MKDGDKIFLFRPVGWVEFDLIAQSGFLRFPPRLPEQPFFYPVCNQQYAAKIARDWNAAHHGVGYVLMFEIDESYISQFETHIVGSREHEEYWIPAEQLEEFNDHLIGPIILLEEFVK